MSDESSIKYIYTSLDWSTKEAVAHFVPFTNVSFNRSLANAGNFQGDLKLDTAGDVLLDATTPKRRLILAERRTQSADGTVSSRLAWLGLVWTRRWSSESKKLQVNAATLEAYFAKRLIRDYLSYTGVDQLEIARQLMQYIQTTAAGPAGDMGVLTPAVTPSGVQPTISFAPEDLVYLPDALKKLGGGADGFDYRIDAAIGTDGKPVFTLALGYPYIGRDYLTTDLVFEYPGNVISYEKPEDATDSANFFRGIGSTGNSTPVVDVVDTGALADGDPVLDSGESYSDVNDNALLASLVNDDARRLTETVEVPSIVVRADLDPEFGTYDPGDWATLYVKDQRHPTGASSKVRVVDIAVRPAANDAAEQITLTLDGAPPS